MGLVVSRAALCSCRWGLRVHCMPGDDQLKQLFCFLALTIKLLFAAALRPQNTVGLRLARAISPKESFDIYFS